MATLKKTQEEAEEKARKAEEELAETNAKAQAVSWPNFFSHHFPNGSHCLFTCFPVFNPQIMNDSAYLPPSGSSLMFDLFRFSIFVIYLKYKHFFWAMMTAKTLSV